MDRVGSEGGPTAPGGGVEEPAFAQGRQSWRLTALVVGGLVAALVAVVALVSRVTGWDLSAAYGGVGVAAALQVGSARTAVRIDASGIAVRRLVGRDRIWTWSEIVEVGVERRFGSWQLAVRPRTAPHAPAFPPVRDLGSRRSLERMVAVLEHWCAIHDVRLTRTADGLGSAPPDSASRSDN